MIKINGPLARAADAASLHGVKVPGQLIQILEKAAPGYGTHWWADHNRTNHEWIDQVSPLIATYENALKPALSRAYNTPWPKARIRVEMSYFTTGVSACTALRPTLITVSSWTNSSGSTFRRWLRTP